jgi:tRNA(Glu) U13 pseudouridine synthase TruD
MAAQLRGALRPLPAHPRAATISGVKDAQALTNQEVAILLDK